MFTLDQFNAMTYSERIRELERICELETENRDLTTKLAEAEAEVGRLRSGLERIAEHLKPYGVSDPNCLHCDEVYGITCEALVGRGQTKQ